jgi:uncharacterized membrane protein YbhN (UPF0104 family)
MHASPLPDGAPDSYPPENPFDEDPGWAEHSHISPGRWVLTALSLVLVLALLAWGLPRLLDTRWADIVTTLADLPAWLIPAAVLLGLGALYCEAVTLRAATPGSSMPTAIAAQLRARGAAIRTVWAAIIAFSFVDLAVGGILIPILGILSYALLALGNDLPGGGWAVVVAALGIAVSILALALVLRRKTFVSLLGRAERSIPGGAGHLPRIMAMRDRVVARLRSRTFLLFGPMLAARLLQWAVLLLATHAVGADVPVLALAGIFLVGRTLALVPVTPGGSGITEAVVALLLVSLGAGAAPAASAALVLSIATLVVPIVAGGVMAAVVLPGARRRTAHGTDS